MKEPGQTAWEKYRSVGSAWWEELALADKKVWARLEAAIRADERAKVIEECAEAFEKRAIEVGMQECCGYGAGSPPECCGDPIYVIDATTGQAAIRALKENGNG